MESHFISYRSSTIHYRRMGHGVKWLFCFHGYGEESGSFEILEAFLGNDYTMIAPDFPFHGITDWHEGLLFEPLALVEVINKIKPPNERMNILGYSMGGRVALQLLQIIPDQIEKTVLIAPDGLHKNKWQWLSTQTDIGNRLFAFTMRNPFWMLGMIDGAAKLGFFNKSIRRFVHYYLDDAEQRALLYRRWTTMRKFRPDMLLVKESILKNKIPVRILFGRYDRVILTAHGIRFSKQAEQFIHVKEAEAGHLLLREKYASLLAQLLAE